MQRKVANPNDASTGPTFGGMPGIASAVKARTMYKNQPVIPSLDQRAAHLPSEVSRVTKQNRQFTSPESDAGVAVGTSSIVAQNNIAEDLGEAILPIKDTLAETSNTDHLQSEDSRQHHHRGATHDRPAWQAHQKPDVSYLEPSPRVTAEHVGATSEDGNTPTKDTLAETPNADHLQPEGLRQYHRRGAAYDRSARQTQQLPDVPYLEPSPRVIAEHVGATLEDTNTPSYDVNESPRVVIGRVNVEVVPPSVIQPSTATQPGPLTAASVSVIGPLGDSASASRRLSLRYR